MTSEIKALALSPNSLLSDVLAVQWGCLDKVGKPLSYGKIKGISIENFKVKPFS